VRTFAAETRASRGSGHDSAGQSAKRCRAPSGSSGHDAVVSALGPPGPGPTTILRAGARSTVEAMRTVGPRRLIVVSAAVLFDDLGVLGGPYGGRS
jgi:NAD(P)H-binding